MGLSEGALLATSDFWAFMGWASGQEGDATARVEMVIESVSAAFSGIVDCDFKPVEEIEETKDGTGKSYLYLDHYPVTELTSVVEDDVELVEGTDFHLDAERGILWKPVGGKWTTSMRGVVVNYEAGHATVPMDVKLACLIEVARTYSMIDKQMWGESSRTEDSVSITINTNELLPATLETLGRYRRVQI